MRVGLRGVATAGMGMGQELATSPVDTDWTNRKEWVWSEDGWSCMFTAATSRSVLEFREGEKRDSEEREKE